MATTAAAAIVIKERHIVESFQRARATSPDRATTPEALGVHEGNAFRLLVGHAVLRETQPGMYYLDEPSWAALGRMRRRIVVVILVAAVVILLTSLIVERVARP